MNADMVALLAEVALRTDDAYLSREAGCVAWIESADRVCGKPVEQHLCARHRGVAEKRLIARRAKEAEWAAGRAERRARLLPEWRAELVRVEAEMDRRDPPRPSDPAAYGGNVHPSIAREARRRLSASNVQRMGYLVRRAEELRGFIGSDEVAS